MGFRLARVFFDFEVIRFSDHNISTIDYFFFVRCCSDFAIDDRKIGSSTMSIWIIFIYLFATAAIPQIAHRRECETPHTSSICGFELHSAGPVPMHRNQLRIRRSQYERNVNVKWRRSRFDLLKNSTTTEINCLRCQKPQSKQINIAWFVIILRFRLSLALRV